MKKTIALLLLIALPAVYAELQLDRIQFDPPIIAAGDEVDVVVQFRQVGIPADDDRLGNPDYTFKVELLPDDSLTDQYVLITDAEGDDVRGTISRDFTYNKRFRVKVESNAPASSYQFKLIGRWYYQDEPEEGEQFLRFFMPVKKEGIILDIATLTTEPSEVRPGDEFVEISAVVENVGEKDAKSVEVVLDGDEGIDASYTNNNRVWVGRVNAGEQKEATFFVDVDEDVSADVYTLRARMTYLDLDNNKGTKIVTIPFLVKPRPYLEVTNVSGEGVAGQTTELKVTVKNTGEQSAEAVDVRILKQSVQPFDLDVRSDYIGELEPGEEGVALFDISTRRDADLKTHNLRLQLRSKGDSDEGDDTIYTYSRRAPFPVTSKAPNYLLWMGLGAAVAVIIAIIARRRRK